MLHRLRAKARPLFAAAVLLTFTTTLPACNKVPLIAPSGSSLTVFSTTTVLPINGSTDIVAVILEGGQGTGTGAGGGNAAGAGTPVHDGTLVTFMTTLGRLDPAEAQTSAGRATVKLIGDGRSGTATITAFSGAARNTVDILIGAAAAARVLLTAVPQSLPPTGGTTTLTARVEDQQGNGLQGVPITFSTTAGTLAAGSVITDKDGVSTTTLTTTAAATVTARAGGTSATLSDTAAITIKPRTTVNLVVPGTAAVSVPTSISVSVGANTIVTNVVLDFGDGEKADLGALSQNTNVIHLYGREGVYTVTATATDSDGATTPVSSQIAVLPLAATGTASPASVQLNAIATFTVTVTPAGAAISSYEWDFGDGVTQTTSGPIVTHSYGTYGPKTVIVRIRPTKGSTLTVIMQVNVIV